MVAKVKSMAGLLQGRNIIVEECDRRKLLNTWHSGSRLERARENGLEPHIALRLCLHDPASQ